MLLWGQIGIALGPEAIVQSLVVFCPQPTTPTRGLDYTDGQRTASHWAKTESDPAGPGSLKLTSLALGCNSHWGQTTGCRRSLGPYARCCFYDKRRPQGARLLLAPKLNCTPGLGQAVALNVAEEMREGQKAMEEQQRCS